MNELASLHHVCQSVGSLNGREQKHGEDRDIGRDTNAVSRKNSAASPPSLATERRGDVGASRCALAKWAARKLADCNRPRRDVPLARFSPSLSTAAGGKPSSEAKQPLTLSPRTSDHSGSHPVSFQPEHCMGSCTSKTGPSILGHKHCRGQQSLSFLACGDPSCLLDIIRPP